PLHDAGPLPQAVHRLLRRFVRAIEEHLHPHADAEDRSAAGESPVDEKRPARSDQCSHAGVEVAHPRHEETVGREHGSWIRGQLHGRADLLERAHGGADVATAVVENHDGWLGHARSSRWSSAVSETKVTTALSSGSVTGTARGGPR